MRPIGVDGLLTEEQFLRLKVAAECKGLSVEELARRMMDEALERMDRGKPGRPVETEEQKKLRALGKSLQGVYMRVREQYADQPQEFEKKFGGQVAELMAAIDRKDLQMLLMMEKEQPWVKR